MRPCLTISESMASHNFRPGCSQDAIVIDRAYTSNFAEWFLALGASPGYNNGALLMLHSKCSNGTEDGIASKLGLR